MAFFASPDISANVSAEPSGWKTASHPKPDPPRGETIVPWHRPEKTSGTAPGPGEKAMQLCAKADLSS